MVIVLIVHQVKVCQNNISCGYITEKEIVYIDSNHFRAASMEYRLYIKGEYTAYANMYFNDRYLIDNIDDTRCANEFLMTQNSLSAFCRFVESTYKSEVKQKQKREQSQKKAVKIISDVIFPSEDNSDNK